MGFLYTSCGILRSVLGNKIALGMIVALFTILIFGRLIHRKRCHNKKVYFVGPRQTGKTTAINAMLADNSDEVIGVKDRTVPTTKSHRVTFKVKSSSILRTINNFEIIEKHDFVNIKDFKHFSINTRDKYIFFIKNSDETYPALSGFDVTFVMWKKDKEESNKNIVYLQEDATKLFELIYAL